MSERTPCGFCRAFIQRGYREAIAFAEAKPEEGDKPRSTKIDLQEAKAFTGAKTKSETDFYK
jgi:hypothetical protein